ncbi:MAG: hypothetical protein WCG20_01525 [bacterium]
MTYIISIIFIILGYYLGKVTCNNHFKKSGIWITIAIFVLINGLHSLIDGVSLVGMSHWKVIGLMAGHELIRQPVLYALFLGMILPFNNLSRWARYGVAFLAVTGVWAVSVIIGSAFGNQLVHIQQFESLIPYLQFLFIGDVIHHVFDWFHHRS